MRTDIARARRVSQELSAVIAMRHEAETKTTAAIVTKKVKIWRQFQAKIYPACSSAMPGD
jgi:hypothetical protein